MTVRFSKYIIIYVGTTSDVDLGKMQIFCIIQFN